MDIKPDQVLDCSGLSCPMPIIKTKKAIDKMETGQILEMISTDKGSVPDMEAWTSRTGNELLGHTVEAEKFIFYIKKT